MVKPFRCGDGFFCYNRRLLCNPYDEYLSGSYLENLMEEQMNIELYKAYGGDYSKDTIAEYSEDVGSLNHHARDDLCFLRYCIEDRLDDTVVYPDYVSISESSHMCPDDPEHVWAVKKECTITPLALPVYACSNMWFLLCLALFVISTRVMGRSFGVILAKLNSKESFHLLIDVIRTVRDLSLLYRVMVALQHSELVQKQILSDIGEGLADAITLHLQSSTVVIHSPYGYTGCMTEFDYLSVYSQDYTMVNFLYSDIESFKIDEVSCEAVVLSDHPYMYKASSPTPISE